MTVLITGFGPFDGGRNASEALVRALAEYGATLSDAAGAPVETLILPVDTERAGGLLADAIQRTKPTRVLLTGQAAGRNRLSLERLARNRRNFSVPDATGYVASELSVLEGSPEAYTSNWPDLDGAVCALNTAGIPAEISEDCGAHLCNQVLYLALHAARETAMPCAVTFLHIPLLPEQVIAGEPAAQRHDRCPYMPLDMSVRGTHILLRHSATLGAAA